MQTLFRLSYVTYSYHGNKKISQASPNSDDFDGEAFQTLGIYSTYEIALERKKIFSKIYYVSNLKRLDIDETYLDVDEWREGFVTI